MEVLKLILKIISSAIMLFYGIGMIIAGVNEIKNKVVSKWLSILMICNGVLCIGMSVDFWLWLW